MSLCYIAYRYTSYHQVYGSYYVLNIDCNFHSAQSSRHCSIIWKRIRTQIHETELCEALESSGETTVERGRCIGDLLKQTALAAFIDRDGEKVFTRSIATYQVPGDVLICSSSETTAGIADAVGVTTWFKLMIIHCPSPNYICFLH